MKKWKDFDSLFRDDMLMLKDVKLDLKRINNKLDDFIGLLSRGTQIILFLLVFCSVFDIEMWGLNLVLCEWFGKKIIPLLQQIEHQYVALAIVISITLRGAIIGGVEIWAKAQQQKNK